MIFFTRIGRGSLHERAHLSPDQANRTAFSFFLQILRHNPAPSTWYLVKGRAFEQRRPAKPENTTTCPITRSCHENHPTHLCLLPARRV